MATFSAPAGSISTNFIRKTLPAAMLFCAAPVASTAQNPNLPDGPGKDTTIRICGACHGVETATSRREDQEGWSAVVTEMIQRGAKGSDDEFSEVVDYLAAHFSKSVPGGKIYVNNLDSKQLETALQLTGAEALAIVHYRNENGKFKSFVDLAKVPGIDVSKLEAKKSSLAY